MSVPNGANDEKEEFGVAVVVFLIGAIAFYLAGDYPVEPQLFPRLVAGVLMLSGIGVAVRAWRRRVGATAIQPGVEPLALPPRLDLTRLAALALIVVYVISLRFVGYVTASLIFIPIAAIGAGAREWRWIVGGTLVFVALTWLLAMRLFHLPLPPDLLLGIFGVR